MQHTLRGRLFLTSSLSALLFINTVQADIRVSVRGLPETLAKDSKLITKVVDLETGSVTSSKTARRASALSIASPANSSLVIATYFSAAKKQALGGHTLIRAAKLTTQSRIRLTIKAKKLKAAAAMRKALAASTGNWPGSRTLIGVRPEDFTSDGNIDRTVRRGSADLVAGSLASSPCADSDEIAVIETDPRIQEARRREFQLCQAGPCPVDRYVAPDNFVKGSISSDGQSTNVELRVEDSQGNTIASGSASGAARDFFGTHDKAVARLIDSLCNSPKLVISSYECPSASCSCCENCPGEMWQPKMTGRAKGKVGATLTVNFPPQTGQINCGEWSPKSCFPLLCCERIDQSQPAWTDFSVTAVLPIGPVQCFCPAQPPYDFGMVAQVTDDINYREEIRDATCP